MAVFDQALGRRIEKIIDCSGKERFPSVYSYIYTWEQPYEVIILEKDGKSVIPAALNTLVGVETASTFSAVPTAAVRCT